MDSLLVKALNSQDNSSELQFMEEIYADGIMAPFNNMRTLKFKAQHAIFFMLPSIIIVTVILKAETNRMDRNPLITTQDPELLNFVKQRTCFLRGPQYDRRQRNTHFE